MQVNSAQDYLTARKRQIISATYKSSAIPPLDQRNSTMYTSVVANGATQRQRFVAPFQGAQGGASGGATFTSQCCLPGGPIALGPVVNSGILRFNVIPPISVTATRV